MSIFYQVTNRDGAISHLFATASLNSEDVVTLPLEVKEAFDQATVCVFENSLIGINQAPFLTMFKKLIEGIAQLFHSPLALPLLQMAAVPLLSAFQQVMYEATTFQSQATEQLVAGSIPPAMIARLNQNLKTIIAAAAAQVLPIIQHHAPILAELIPQIIQNIPNGTRRLENLPPTLFPTSMDPYPYSEEDINNIKKNLQKRILTLLKDTVKTFDEMPHLFPEEMVDRINSALSSIPWSNVNQAIGQVLETMPVNRISPLFLAMLSSADMKWPTSLDTEGRLDFQLLTHAKVQQKEINYLETDNEAIDHSYGLNLSPAEAVEFFHFHESHKKAISADISSDLKRSYVNQDIDEVKRLMRSLSSFANAPAAVGHYYNALDAHADVMTDRARGHLDRGNAFIAVDAVSLPGMITKLRADGFRVEPVELSTRLYPIAGTLEDGQKVAAFRKIYNALYAAQSSAFKRKGLFPDAGTVLSIEHIQDYVAKNPNSRSATAWQLAMNHFQDTTANNLALVASIHQYGFEHSSTFGFFKRTVNFVNGAQSVTPEVIQAAAANSRTGLIRDTLGGFQNPDLDLEPGAPRRNMSYSF